MIFISPTIQIAPSELSFSQIRAQGAGGQNVNKVSSAVQLRFDIIHSTLPPYIKQNLLKSNDSRITKDGVIVIKSQNHRTFERNKDDATQRLTSLIRKAAIIPKKRKPTKPKKSAIKKRVDRKVKHGKLKKLRKKIHN